MKLTKSLFMTGLKCDKLLWININKKEILPEQSLESKHNTEQGTKVGILATKTFPDGINLNGLGYRDNLIKTKEAIEQRKPIFEAGIEIEDCFARVDILNPANEDEWDIIEVKSGTKVEPHHIPDVAFQKQIVTKAGLKIRDCYLMHINNKYIKEGDINYNDLFAIENINEKVNQFLPQVEGEIARQLDVTKLGSMPKTVICEDCNKPYTCDFKKDCWSILPEENVTQIYYNKKLGFELLEQGITQIKDIPDGTPLKYRPAQQAIQIKCAKENIIHLDKEKVNEFLDTLEYPICYFDFETYAPAVPIYDGMNAYQRIPFQYSLHIEKDDDSVEHKSFLAKDSNDPRLDLLKQLVDDLGTDGSIVVYHKSFEIGVLNELAKAYPEFEEQVQSIIERIIDLEEPFAKFHYYNPRQNGSASIKYVLPALTDISYEGMGIGNGIEAYVNFARVTYNEATQKEKEQVWEDLEKYCAQDTWAEVEIIRKLAKLSNSPIELINNILPEKFQNPSVEQIEKFNSLIFFDFEKPTDEEIEERNAYATQFIKDSKRDLEDVKLQYDNKRFHSSSYYLQQAVEKITKAYGVIFFNLSKKYVENKMSHKTPKAFIKAVREPYMQELVALFKTAEPNLKTDVTELERTINEKETELAQTNREVIEKFLQLIDTLTIKLEEQNIPGLVKGLLHQLKEGIGEYDESFDWEKLTRVFDEKFKVELLMSFISLYLLSGITYGHVSNTRYSGQDIQPEDYKEGLGIVDCTPQIIPHVQKAIDALECFMK
ncbi:hypothetical protein BVX95_02005 [archaeon D22]|nr:hypothetical protein BVX95_02005 [archaeon D22]